MYAVIETGGKQYRLAPGEAVNVEKLTGEVGDRVSLGQVLLVADDEGNVTVGNPFLEGVSIEAEIVVQGRGQKILVFKYKPKANYRRRQGHRQPYTRVRVVEIGAPAQAPKRRARKTTAKAPETVEIAEATTGGEA